MNVPLIHAQISQHAQIYVLLTNAFVNQTIRAHSVNNVSYDMNLFFIAYFFLYIFDN